MPKMKSNRLAMKKFRITGSGKFKKARAGTSHNSGKKSAKRIRNLRGRTVVDATNEGAMRRVLPYASASK